MICDFCSTPNPTWEYPAEDVTYEHLGAQSTGAWVACDECAALIEREDWDGLAQRALLTPTVATLASLMGTAWAVGEAKRLHDGFRSHRRGRVRRA